MTETEGALTVRLMNPQLVGWPEESGRFQMSPLKERIRVANLRQGEVDLSGVRSSLKAGVVAASFMVADIEGTEPVEVTREAINKLQIAVNGEAYLMNYDPVVSFLRYGYGRGQIPQETEGLWHRQTVGEVLSGDEELNGKVVFVDYEVKRDLLDNNLLRVKALMVHGPEAAMSRFLGEMALGRVSVEEMPGRRYY